jgi:hypothetical protein
MSFMFELYYRSPEDKTREARIVAEVAAAGGHLDYREPEDRPDGPICLAFEFESREQAELAEEALRKRGEHTEGVCDYG